MTSPHLPFSRSCWIGGPSWQTDAGGEQNRYFAFRKLLVLPGEVRQAQVRLTADARYLLWVNGQQASRGPARCFPEHQAYDEVDLAPYLHVGENWIAVLVHQFGVSTGQYLFRYRTGLLLEGDIELANGETLLLRTDLSWQAQNAAWYGRTNARLTQHIGFQERVHAGQEPADWRCPADAQAAVRDADWRAPFYLGPPGCPPWTGYEPRGLAPMAETLESPDSLVWAAVGQHAENVHTADNLLDVWRAETHAPLSDLPRADADGWVRIAPEPGQFVTLAFDFGWNHAAYARVETQGTAGGEIIDSIYATGLNATGEPLPCAGFGAPYEGVADRVVAAPGNTSWESFLPRGYRYHVVTVRAPLALRVTACRTHHAVTARPFACADETITRIWETAERTLRAGMLDAFVDNNSREQAQWLGDACVSALGAAATYGDTSLWRRALRQAAQSHAQYPSGALNSVLPTEPTFMSIPDQDFNWVHSLSDYFLLTGDRELLQECLPALQGFLRVFAAPNMTEEGLFIQPDGHCAFLDWAVLDKSPYSLTLNLLLLRAWRSAHSVAQACGDTAFAAFCADKDAVMTRVITERFWSDAHGAWLDHLTPNDAVAAQLAERIPGAIFGPWNIPPREDGSYFACVVQSNAQAVALGLGTPEQQAQAAAFLARALVPGQQETNVAGPYWMDRILTALFSTGQEQAALQALRDWYGRDILDAGATTFTEGWHATRDSHAQTWGSSVNWAISGYLLGIRPLTPGFTEAIFDPRPGDLAWARGTVSTPHGDITVAWARNAQGVIEAEITAPPQVTIHRAASLS